MREDQAKKVIDFLVSQANVWTRANMQARMSGVEPTLHENYTKMLTTKDQICELGLVRDDWRMSCPFWMRPHRLFPLQVFLFRPCFR